MKKIMLVPMIVLLFVLGTTASHSLAAKAITIFVDGEMQPYSNEAIIQNGTTLVPLRGIFEALGASVVWNQKDKTISASRNGKKIWLKIGSTTAQVNGKNVQLSVPAKVMNGKTLVPLRFIGESLGEQVKWDASKSAILIGYTDLNDILFSLTVNEVQKFENGYLLDKFSSINIDVLQYETVKYGYSTVLTYYFEYGKLTYFVYDFLPYNEYYHSWNEMSTIHRLLHDKAQAELGKGEFILDGYSSLVTVWERGDYTIALNVNDDHVYTSAELIFYNNR